MFTGERVKHNKFGFGTVADITIKPGMPLLDAVLVIDFDEAGLKKLQVRQSAEFMNYENLETEEYVAGLIKEEKEKRAEEIANRTVTPKIRIKKVYQYDENERVVTKADWERCLKVAETYRFAHESRAVVADNDVMFINAACGLRYAEADPRFGNHVYDRCEGIKRSKYAGCRWRYATKEEIQKTIDEWDEVNGN